MKKLEELMKDKKEIKMPEHKAKARLELVKAMKQLAQDLMMEDFQSKLGSPDAVAIKVKMAGEIPESEEMSKDEAMDADMDMFRDKEAALLKALPESEDEMEDESEDEDEMEESDDVEQLKMLLKQKKSEDSEY